MITCPGMFVGYDYVADITAIKRTMNLTNSHCFCHGYSVVLTLIYNCMLTYARGYVLYWCYIMHWGATDYLGQCPLLIRL